MQFKFALRNVMRNPKRSLLLVATTATTVFGIFIFDGFNQGILNQYRIGIVKGLMGSGHVFQKGYRDETLDNPWEKWVPDAAPLRESLRSSNLLLDAYPRIRFPAFLTNGKMNLTAMGEGIDAAAEEKFFDSLKIIEGKNLTTEAEGVLLGDGLAKSLNLKIGDTLTVLTSNVRKRLAAADLKVTGIFFTGMKNFDDVYFRIQLAKAQEILETPKVEYFSIGLQDLNGWQNFSHWMEKNTTGLESTSFEEIDKAYYENSVKFLNSQFAMFAIIFMTIGILGVFNITSISVLERTREFGILRINGESRASVTKLVLIETLFVSIIGGALGILVAYTLTHTLLKKGIFMPPAPGFSNEYYAQIKLISLNAFPSLAVGIVASLLGAIPAVLRATKKSLGESLRYV